MSFSPGNVGDVAVEQQVIVIVEERVVINDFEVEVIGFNRRSVYMLQHDAYAVGILHHLHYSFTIEVGSGEGELSPKHIMQVAALGHGEAVSIHGSA